MEGDARGSSDGVREVDNGRRAVLELLAGCQEVPDAMVLSSYRNMLSISSESDLGTTWQEDSLRKGKCNTVYKGMSRRRD